MALEIQTLGARQYFIGTVAEILAGDDSAVIGDMGFATDALKAAESTSNGTGNQVFWDGTIWTRVDTGVVMGA